jgi:peroxiredoxin
MFGANRARNRLFTKTFKDRQTEDQMSATDQHKPSDSLTSRVPHPTLERFAEAQGVQGATGARRTMAEQIASLETVLADLLAPEARGRFKSEQRDLDTIGTPEAVTDNVGQPMPDGTLLNPHGNTTSLTEARAGKPAVVVSYRGDWCPYCNVQLRVYQQQLVPSLSERGITLVAISPQKPDGSLSLQEANDLTFSVLSDPGHQIAGSLGILTSPNEGARQSHADIGLDVPDSNIDGSYILAMPTVAIVDRNGILRWIDVHPNYATRTEPRQILDALASLDL